MIKVYTKEGCPKCKVLKMKLEKKGIVYEEFKDVEAMIAMGIRSCPLLEVDGKRLDFPDAVKYVNEMKGNA